MQKQTVSIEQARKDLQEIVGLPVARAWKGYGTTIFLELGRLYRRDIVGKEGQMRESVFGDYSLCIETDWKILKDNKVIMDATDFYAEGTNRKPIKEALEQFVGTHITDTQLSSDASTLTVVFDSGITLQVEKSEDGTFYLISTFRTPLSFDADGSIYYDYSEL